MKKLTVLVQPKDQTAAVERLRALGVVHVEQQNLPQAEASHNIQEDIALIEQAIAVLAPEQKISKQKPLEHWREQARHIRDLASRLNQLREYSLTVNNAISQWQDWGDFDPEIVRGLEAKGIFVKFYQIPLKKLNSVPKDVIIRKISVSQGAANCLVISRQNTALSFKQLTLPKQGLSAMRARLTEDARIIELIQKEITRLSGYYRDFLRVKQEAIQELEFKQVLSGMGQANGIAYLSGYIPDDAVRQIEKAAQEENWGLMIKPPAPDEQVPTLIRNPRWISIIEPVFKLIEIVPGYKELDISLWFLIFFAVFFGMLVGDMGIGLVFLLAAFLAQRKFGPRLESQALFLLLYVSSVCIIIWGALTGTFFGRDWLPLIKPLVPALRDDQNIQRLCFFIGAVHLSIAHFWRALRRAPSVTALAEIGWVLILWGAFFLARMLVLAEGFPAQAKWLFAAGAGLVVFFTSPRKNIIKGIGSGIANLVGNFVNNFTDIVSYIRLFAVGLATVAVADAFNKMALDIGFGSIISGAMAALILLLGHSLNIVLAPMSVIVHGVRLNVLEFCGHLGVTWSGFSYKPLRKKQED